MRDYNDVSAIIPNSRLAEQRISDLSKRPTWQRQLVARLYLHRVVAQSLHGLMGLFASWNELAVVFVPPFLQP